MVGHFRTGRQRRLEWVLVGLLCASAAAESQTAPDRIPVAHGTTIAGQAVALPDALNGKVGVLVVGFSHAAQNQVQDWGRRVGRDYNGAPAVQYFEIPMLAAAPRMVRGMIIRKMTSGVSGAERNHFLPLTEDEKAWRIAAEYSASDDAYLLLVDRSGTVQWRTHGAPTDRSYFELKDHIGALLKR